MSLPLFDAQPAWAELFSLAGHLAAGSVVGVLHFRSLWWTIRRLTGGDRMVTAIALMIGRFFLLGGLLTLASLEGALPLLMMGLGLLIGRSLVMRRTREAAP